MPFDLAEDAAAWLEFVLRPGVSPAAQQALLRRFGSPHAAIRASPREVAQACRPEVAQAFIRGPSRQQVEETLRWLQAPGRHLVTLADEAYPRALLAIADPPTLLYASGRIDLLETPGIAIVGSRNATPGGKRDAHAFARGLSAQGLCVASGLALGIDAAAHRGALCARGSTVAVIGTGPDISYPPGNEELARELAGKGCIISEFPLGTPPLPGNFPRRNRLISGLARGVVVVEAAAQSGSLLTAACALDQGRDVFAVPGSIHSTLSKGCHELIKRGAILVQTAEDVLEEYGLKPRGATRAGASRAEPADAVLRAMGFAPVCVDDLVELTGLAAAQVAARLATLEIEGCVKGLAGGRFQREAGAARSRVIE